MKRHGWAKTTLYKTKKVSTTLIGEGKGKDVPCVNCTVGEYGLKTRMGAVKVKDGKVIDAKVNGAFYSFLYENIWAFASDGVYSLDVKSQHAFSFLEEMVDFPTVFLEDASSDERSLVCLCGKDYYTLSPEGVFSNAFPHCVLDACMHYGKVFYIDADDPYKIGWSANGVYDWTEGIDVAGSLRLDVQGGKAIRILSAEEKLIIIRQNALTVMRALGNPEHFRIDGLALSTEDVIAQSCCTNGDNVYFATTSALYRFSGSRLERLENGVDYDVYAFKKGVFLGDNYVLQCSSKTYGDDILFVYDVRERVGYYVLLHAEELFVGDSIYAISNGYVYRLGEDFDGNGTWFSRTVTLGDIKPKLAKTLNVVCDATVNVKVCSQRGERSFCGSGLHVVNMRAPYFIVKVEGKGRIKKLSLTCEVPNGI